MSKPIKFRHRYYKLERPVFTTIRGKAQFKRIKVGDIQEVVTPSGMFKAKVINLELARVGDMLVSFLKLDAEYPGFTINSHDDFVRLLNSFRSPTWSQVTIDSELTIITLEKIP